MKKYRIILLGLVLLFTMPTVWAQSDRKEQRKIERAEKKRLKEEERQRRHEQVLDLVEDQTYVLEANTLTGRYGHQFQVSPNINFVKVEGNQLIVQTANNTGVGYNGLGGITLNGTIKDYQVNKSKKGVSVLIQFFDPILGHSTLNLDVSGSGAARAMVVGNWGSRITFQGQFVPLEESRVFKGRTII